MATTPTPSHGFRLSWYWKPVPGGWIAALFTHGLITRLAFGLDSRPGPIPWVTDAVEFAPWPDAVDRIHSQLSGYFAGADVDPASWDSPMDVSACTPFQKRVYAALRRVGRGEVISYAVLARLAGSEKGARAVGTAMARNPIPLLIPCHRVVAASDWGGFSAPGGLDSKKYLLKLEGRTDFVGSDSIQR